MKAKSHGFSTEILLFNVLEVQRNIAKPNAPIAFGVKMCWVSLGFLVLGYSNQLVSAILGAFPFNSTYGYIRFFIIELPLTIKGKLKNGKKSLFC